MNFYHLNKLKQLSRRLIVFNGRDEVFLAGLCMGADGAIGSTYNFMGDKFVEIYHLFREGRIEEAKALQTRANGVMKVLTEVGVYQGIKYILGLLGIDAVSAGGPLKL